MALRNKNPQDPRNSDRQLAVEYAKFQGMVTGEPVVRIPSRGGHQFAGMNTNVIDRGDYFEVRGGSKLYTNKPHGYKFYSYGSDDKLQVDASTPWITGDAVYFYGPDLPVTILEDTAYYYRYNGSEESFTLHPTRIDAFNDVNVVAVGDALVEGDAYILFGKVNAFCDHTKAGLLIFLFGSSVYVADKALTTYTKVLNLGIEDPSNVSTIIPLGENAILASRTGGIFKIVLTQGPAFYMFPVNNSGPTVLIPNAEETTAKKYGYYYIHSLASIPGAQNGNRTVEGGLILSETGTTQAPEKDYGEVYFESAVGLDESQFHVIAEMVNENSVGMTITEEQGRGMTHIPIYRTQNIGVNSGGTSADATGLGNDASFMIWVDDVPICRAFKLSLTVIGEGPTGTAVVNGGNTFVLGDVGSQLYVVDADANEMIVKIVGFTSTTEVTISTYDDNHFFSHADCYAVLGGKRVIKASQSNKVITVSAPVFYPQPLLGLANCLGYPDAGIILFLSDGSLRHVDYVFEEDPVGNPGIFSFAVLEDTDFTDLAVGFQELGLTPDSVVYGRAWNDTLPDLPIGSRVTWKDRQEYGGQTYIPARFFKPIPNVDIIYSSDGFLVAAERYGTEYRYCSLGDRPWNIGQHKYPEQRREITGSISHIIGFPFKAVIMCSTQTGVLTLNSAQNIGRESVGENIFQLPELSIVDSFRGVVAWKSIVYKNQNIIYAITNESAYRAFDGIAWSKNDFGFVNGLDAVSKEYLNKIDNAEVMGSSYNSKGGIKLWFSDGAGAEKSLRYATEAGEGLGWSLVGNFLTSTDWVIPFPEFGIFQFLDGNNIQRVVVLDKYDLRFYEIDTYDRITDTKKFPLDKEGVADTEIAWSKKWREMAVDPSSGNQTAVHENTTIIIQPAHVENRGATGYTASGQRDAQELTLKMYVDGEVITKKADSVNIPEGGDITFSGRRTEFGSIILELIGTASEIIVSQLSNFFLGKTKSASRAGRTMTEHTLQKELSTGMAVHICRGTTMKNRVTGEVLGGGTLTPVTGPDGRSSSGMQFSQNITLDNAALATYTIVLWSKEANTSLISGITGWVALGAAVNSWQMYYKKGSNLAASRTLILGSKFNVRIYNKTISDGALALLREDTVDFNGKMLLPGF